MLDKASLKADIKSILTDMETRTGDAKDEFAQRLSDAIDAFVKGAEVVYQTGLVAPSGGGPVTGQITHTIQ